MLNFRFHGFRLLSAALLLVSFGCSERQSAVDRALAEQILHFGNGTEPADLDPHTVTGVPESHIITALFEGLVAPDPVDLSPVPGVAETWDISADKRVYTFHLREDARWSNGDPITARDFVESYKRMLTPALGAEYAYMLHYMVGAKEYNTGKLTDFSKVGVKEIDPQTLEITLQTPTPFFLQMLNHYSWFPVHIPTVESFGGLERKGTRWTRPENFVGNGPFVLKSWKPNQVIVTEKSPTYWDRETVRLNQIHFYPIESSDTEERMFRSGQLHRTGNIPLTKIAVYREENPASLRIDPALGTYFYRLNTTVPPFDDPRVRRALALAVDRESLVKNVTLGGQQPAYHFTPPVAGYEPKARLSGGLEEARRLLAEAGYPGGQGFPTVEILFNTLESHRVIAEAIQQMWKTSLNIDVRLLNQEWKVYLDAQDTLAYQIARAGWMADYVDPHSFLEMFVTDGGNNDTGWSNPEYDRLLASSLGALSERERFAIYEQMEKILVDEAPVIPLYFYTHPHLLHPSVQGKYPTVLDHFAYKHIYLEAPETAVAP